MSRRSIAAGILNGVDPASNPSPGMDPEVLRVLDMLDRQYAQQQSMGPKGVAGIMRDQPIPEEYPDAINPVGFTFPQDIARAVIRQPYTAGEAVGEALHEPSIPNATNAAVQTALAVGKPFQALGFTGAGIGAGAMSDLDLIGTAQAESKKKKTAVKTFANGYTEDDLRPIAEMTGTPIAALGTMRRKDVSAMMAQVGVASGTKKAEAEAETQRLERERYERALAAANNARERELRSDTSFATSNSVTKDVYDKLGGAAPMLAAFGLGAVTRGAFKKFSPKKDKDFGWTRDVTAPAIAGTGAAFGTMNIPQFTDMLAPSANPKKSALQAYATELQLAGYKDEAQRALDIAKELPDENPVQATAYEQFYGQLPKRLGVAGIEGLTFGKAGASGVKIGGRLYDWATRERARPKGRAAGSTGTTPRGPKPGGGGPRNSGPRPRNPKPGPKGPQGPAPGSQAMSYPESSLYDAAMVAAAMGRRKK